MTTSLVLGGSSGMGAAVTLALRSRGDTVVVADFDEDGARRVLAVEAPGQGHFIAVDLAGPEAPGSAVDVAAELGNGVIDTVFYNAGVLTASPLAAWTVEDWDRSVAVNLRGPFLTAQAAAEPLARSASGSFIINSSTGALRGHAGMPAYHATKAGLLGLVRALADEWGPAGVRINALLPGWIDTPFNDDYWDHQDDADMARQNLVNSIPLRRQGDPEDVVGAVLFLASPAAAYITGQAIVVDGGYTAV